MPDVDDGDAGTDSDQDDIFGVRFTRTSTNDLNTTMVVFTTPEVPVWGDFYAKDGGGTGTSAIYAYNAGFGTDPAANATSFINWIPRPDGQPRPVTQGEVPETASLIVWSLLVGSVGLVAQRRRQRAAA